VSTHNDPCDFAADDGEFQRGVDLGSSAGWWDATVRADLELGDLQAAHAPEQFVAGARHIVDDLKSTDYSVEGYRLFRKAIADVARIDEFARVVGLLRDRAATEQARGGSAGLTAWAVYATAADFLQAHAPKETPT
jgi:hypothetical protein